MQGKPIWPCRGENCSRTSLVVPCLQMIDFERAGCQHMGWEMRSGCFVAYLLDCPSWEMPYEVELAKLHVADQSFLYRVLTGSLCTRTQGDWRPSRDGSG